MILADVKVNKLHLGGGFGWRGQQDYTRQAVLIAKQVPDRPIKLIWSREEDTTHDPQCSYARDWMPTAMCLRCTRGCRVSPSSPI